MTSQNRFTIEIDGLKTLQENLTKVTPRVARNILKGFLYDIATRLRDRMRETVHKRTGRLRRSIVARRGRGTRDVIVAEVYTKTGKGVKNDGWYWHFIEYGTEHSSAFPFVRPSIKEVENKIPLELESIFMRRFLAAVEREKKIGKQ